MILVLKPNTPKERIDAIMDRIKQSGCRPLYLPGRERIVIGAIGDDRALSGLQFQADPWVESVKRVLSPHRLVSREFHPHDSIVSMGSLKVGGERFAVIAGPAMVESAEQLESIAQAISSAGGSCLRAGVFCTTHDPYAFRGLGAPGLELLARVARECDMPCLTEVVGSDTLEMIAGLVDAVALDEYSLRDARMVEALGNIGKPVLLESSLAGDLDELLLAAEHIVLAGNSEVVLCERGIRTFERITQATLDLGAVPYLKQKSHLPVVVDLARSVGRRELIAPMAKAAVACGADGLIVQVHDDPAQALASGHQALNLEQFEELMHGLRPFIAAAGRVL